MHASSWCPVAPSTSSASVQCLCSAPPYIAYQVIAALLCVTCWFLYCLLRTGTLVKLQDRLPAAAPLLLTLGASLPGTQTLILTKAVSMMFVVSVGGQNQLTHWYFWIAAMTPFLSTSTWTAAMQHGLSTYPTVVIVPLLQVMYTTVGVLCGVLFFQEYRQMSNAAIVMYLIGFLGMFGGICLSVSPASLAAGLQEMKERAAVPTSDPGSCELAHSSRSCCRHCVAGSGRLPARMPQRQLHFQPPPSTH